MDATDRYGAAKKITLIGAFNNALLAVIKIIFGIIGFSHALIADGVHSIADLLTDGLVLAAAKFGSRSADYDHPYGHQRIETAATVALAVLLILAGIGIMLDASEHLMHGVVEKPKSYVLLIALFSVITNEILFHYTLRVAKKTSSQLLRANAWHHRSDAAASLVVLIGVAGAMLGFHFLDAVAAIIVSLMIIKMGFGLAWSCVRELVDTGVEPEVLAEINAAILRVPGVKMIHQLRTRRMGDNILADVHVIVAPEITVSEGHYIATKVHHTLMHDVPNVSDVTVHIDPENDEENVVNINLPDRVKIIEKLSEVWKNCPGYAEIKKINLHYLAGRVSVEVVLPMGVLRRDEAKETIENCYKQNTVELELISKIIVYFA